MFSFVLRNVRTEDHVDVQSLQWRFPPRHCCYRCCSWRWRILRFAQDCCVLFRFARKCCVCSISEHLSTWCSFQFSIIQSCKWHSLFVTRRRRRKENISFLFFGVLSLFRDDVVVRDVFVVVRNVPIVRNTIHFLVQLSKRNVVVESSSSSSTTSTSLIRFRGREGTASRFLFVTRFTRFRRRRRLRIRFFVVDRAVILSFSSYVFVQ